MAKSYSNLYEQMLSYEFVEDAFNNAARHKTRQKSVRRALANKESVIRAVLHILKNRSYTPSRYNVKNIYIPKERQLFVANFVPDRIIHHCVMKILIPILQPKFYEYSYSCIEGKGQHQAVLKNIELTKKYKYFCKCDISKFYPSIHKGILLNLFRRIIKDPDMYNLINSIITNVPASKWNDTIYTNFKNKVEELGTFCRFYNKPEQIQFSNIKLHPFYYELQSKEFDIFRNVPIGNYCSQWFGNFYLTEMDNLIAQHFRPTDEIYGKYFTDRVVHIRYCDDFIMYSNNKDDLRNASKIIQEYLLHERRLVLSKCFIAPTWKGVDFCGYVVYNDGSIKIRKITKQRIARTVKRIIHELKIGKITLDKASSVLGSYYGIIKFINAKKFDTKIKISNFLSNINKIRKYSNISNNKIIIDNDTINLLLNNNVEVVSFN